MTALALKISLLSSISEVNQDGRVVKALDLSSNGRMSAWVRTPLLVYDFASNWLICGKNRIPEYNYISLPGFKTGLIS